MLNKALFSCKSFVLVLGTITFLFLFGNYCPIIDKLGSKDSSCDLQTNCAINFYLYLYLMLFACDIRFNVTENFEFFLVFGELNKA